MSEKEGVPQPLLHQGRLKDAAQVIAQHLLQILQSASAQHVRGRCFLFKMLQHCGRRPLFKRGATKASKACAVMLILLLILDC